jgi:hypothetical protein
MPWFEENGLLPGRGVPSIVAAADFSSATGSPATDAATGGGSTAAGAGGSVTSEGFGLSATAGASGAGLAFGFAGSFLAGACFFGKAPFSLAATGGVIVEEPPLTYSPSSSNLAKAVLVSIPSSLAISYTRGSATFFLLFGADPKQGRP